MGFWITENKEIERNAWNQFVAKNHGPIYILAWFLDCVSAEQWKLFWYEENDLKGAIPFAIKQRFGLSQIYQPIFCQQMGFVGDNRLRYKTIEAFFKHVLSKALYVDYTFNAGDNAFFSSRSIPQTEQKVNQLIDLGTDMDLTFKRFRRDRKRDVQKAGSNFLLRREMDFQKIETFLEVSKSLEVNYLNQKQKGIFKNLIQAQLHEDSGGFYILEDADGVAQAGGFFPIFEKTMYNLFIGRKESHLGKYMYARLFYELINAFHTKLDFLDLEGSNIPGVQDFFESLGAEKTNYTYYRKRGLN